MPGVKEESLSVSQHRDFGASIIIPHLNAIFDLYRSIFNGLSINLVLNTLCKQIHHFLLSIYNGQK